MCKHPPFPQTLHRQKRCSLHATQSTHFTIIPFIIDINLLSYIRPHMGRHMGPRAIRRVQNFVPSPNLGPVQEDMNIPNSRGLSICPRRRNRGCLVGPDRLFAALCQVLPPQTHTFTSKFTSH